MDVCQAVGHSIARAEERLVFIDMVKSYYCFRLLINFFNKFCPLPRVLEPFANYFVVDDAATGSVFCILPSYLCRWSLAQVLGL